MIYCVIQCSLVIVFDDVKTPAGMSRNRYRLWMNGIIQIVLSAIINDPERTDFTIVFQDIVLMLVSKTITSETHAHILDTHITSLLSV